MLLRKGVFPYDWFNSLEKVDETQLPPKEAFHSKLNNSNITDDDVEHALKMWDNFKIKTFCEYHDLYMKLNVLLLTDVFENFRRHLLIIKHLISYTDHDTHRKF